MITPVRRKQRNGHSDKEVTVPTEVASLISYEIRKLKEKKARAEASIEAGRMLDKIRARAKLEVVQSTLYSLNRIKGLIDGRMS